MKNMNNCNKNMLARVNDGFNKNFAPTLFDFFSRPLADFDNMFTPMATDNARVDIKDLGDRYQLKADMPGVKKEDIKVDFENGDLTIRADHHKECNKKMSLALWFMSVQKVPTSVAFILKMLIQKILLQLMQMVSWISA